MVDRRWRILIVLFFARTAMGFQFQSIASTSSFLMKDLHLDFAAVGSLIGLYMIPGIIVSFPSGLLVRRYGNKRLCVAGLVLMVGGGILLGFMQEAAGVSVARLISGVGAVVFNLVLTKMAADWFTGREIVVAMGVVLASWPFAIAAGLLIQPVVAASYGWHWVMYLTSAICALALLLIVTGYREPSIPAAISLARERLPVLPPLLQLAPAIIAGVMWGNLNLALVLFFSFAPAALTELGFPKLQSAAWVSLALWIIMLSVPLGGLAIQKTARTDASIVVLSLASALSLALLPLHIAPLVCCILFGLTIGPPAGAIMALPSRVLKPENLAGGLGVFLTVYYVILSFGPSLAGLVRERYNTAGASVWFGASLMAVTAVLMWLFRHAAGKTSPAK